MTDPASPASSFPIHLTDSAKAMLTRYFQEHPATPIRLEYAEGGCAGPRLQLRLASTAAQLNDLRLECDGFAFIVDAALLQAAAPVTIDAGRLTFAITSRLQLEGAACGSCKGCS
ncbi:iron-sulfur cluster biosynthesis family protein [Megalodesulfovibrio paquesii]